MLLPRPLLLLSSLILSRPALGDVEFTKPAGGASLTGGRTIRIEWKDSGNAPSISDLKTYQLILCAGGNANPVQLGSIVELGQFSSGNEASGVVQLAIGASTPANAYFLKMISVAAAGGTVINYSKRFSLTGMTGTFPSTVLDGLTDPSNTDGPPSQNQIAGQGNRPDADGSFAVPYTLQTGPTRYAPMQPQPMTKILANKATPLWPTSSVPIAKTWLPPANGIKTTVTQSNTFSVASRPNDASPASQPTGDMAKFLARWKD